MIDNISLTVQTVSSAPGGATQTAIVDYSEVVTKIELSTQRFDAPASLAFTLLEESGIAIAEGSSVEFSADGIKMFKGYVFTAERNRDGEVSYTRIKLVRKNKESGRADAYVHEDTDTIKSWGLLQYYDEVDENLNEAQIDEMCKQYLQYYNRVLQTITIDAMGIPGLRAGMIIPVKIGAISELSMVRLMLTEKVTHTFDGGGHTMSIEVKDFSQLGGMSVV